MNRVCIEGVLAHRPVVTSRVSHVADVLGAAIVEVGVGKIDEYCSALERLKDDPDFYQLAIAMTENVSDPFYDRTQGYRSMLHRALNASLQYSS